MELRKSHALAISMARTGSALLRHSDSRTIREHMRAQTMASPEEFIAAFEMIKSTPIFGELHESLKEAKDSGALE